MTTNPNFGGRPSAPSATPATMQHAHHAPLRKGDIICPNPNCGYRGPADRKSRGSLITGLVLCCLFLLPGILYFMFFSGYRYSCPVCRVQVRNDN